MRTSCSGSWRASKVQLLCTVRASPGRPTQQRSPNPMYKCYVASSSMSVVEQVALCEKRMITDTMMPRISARPCSNAHFAPAITVCVIALELVHSARIRMNTWSFLWRLYLSANMLLVRTANACFAARSLENLQSQVGPRRQLSSVPAGDSCNKEDWNYF